VTSIAVAIALGSAAVPLAAAPAPDAADAAQRSARIMQAIGDAACDSDVQCRVIGIGARACGGPQAYVAWSTARTDGAALQRLVDEDARAARKELDKAGINSTCVMPPVPDVQCRPSGERDAGGHCVLLERARGRATPR
jgi:hypothetical protein